MKIDVNEDYSFLLSEVYNGIGIKTDAGVFAICQRDGGIEIRLGDGPWYAWYDDEGPKSLAVPINPNEECELNRIARELFWERHTKLNCAGAATSVKYVAHSPGWFVRCLECREGEHFRDVSVVARRAEKAAYRDSVPGPQPKIARDEDG